MTRLKFELVFVFERHRMHMSHMMDYGTLRNKFLPCHSINYLFNIPIINQMKFSQMISKYIACKLS